MEPAEANTAPSYRVLKTAGKMTRYGWSLAQDQSTDRVVVLEVSDRDAFQNLDARDPLKRLMTAPGLSAEVIDRRADERRVFVVSAQPKGEGLSSALSGLTPEQRLDAAARLVETVGRTHGLEVTLGALHPSFYYWNGETVVFAAPGLAALCTAGGVNGAELAGVLEEYAAPELAVSGPSVATDLFALGRFLKALAPAWSEGRWALAAGLTSPDTEPRALAFAALSRQLRGSRGRMVALAAVTAAFFAACVVSLALVLGGTAEPAPPEERATAGDAMTEAQSDVVADVPVEKSMSNVALSDRSFDLAGAMGLTVPDEVPDREERSQSPASVLGEPVEEAGGPQRASEPDLRDATIVEKVDDRRDDVDPEPLPAATKKRKSESTPARVLSQNRSLAIDDLLVEKDAAPRPEAAAPKEPEPAGPLEEPGDFEKHLAPLPRTPQAELIVTPPAELTPADRKHVERLFQEAAKPVPARAASTQYETFEERARRTALLEVAAYRHASVTRGLGILVRNPSADVRRAAAEALGKQDTVEAVGLLVDLVVDADDSVTQFARKALAALRDAAAVQVLFETVLPRASSALVRAEAASALGLIGDPRSLPALCRSLKDPDGGVRGAAAEALGRLRGAGAVEDLLVLLGDSDSRAKAGASLALGALRVEPAREKLETLLRDSAPVVRRAACRALVALRNPASVPALVRLLDREPGALKDDCVRGLILLTGVNLDDRVKGWVEWWQKNKDTFRVPPLTKALKVLEEAHNAAAYYGIRTYSRRIVFLIDISGSMAGSPLAQAKEKLIETVSGFTPQHHFNVIAFETELRPWRRTIWPCTPENRGGATKFVNNLQSTGTTNIFGALKMALEDPNADTIFLLSDGAPSAGAITDTHAIQAAVRKLNKDRQAVIHCIALGGADETFMNGLASENGGQFVKVER
jgi:HEAT repeat protein